MTLSCICGLPVRLALFLIASNRRAAALNGNPSCNPVKLPPSVMALSSQTHLLYQLRDTLLRPVGRRAQSILRQGLSNRSDGLLPSPHRYPHGSTRRTKYNPSNSDRFGISPFLRTPVAAQIYPPGKFG